MSHEETPESTAPPDLTRPPRETFRPAHHARMKTLPLDRPTWASKLYEESFEHKEPKTNPYTSKRFRSYAAAATSPAEQSPANNNQPAEHPVSQSQSLTTRASKDPVPPTTSTAQTTNVSSLTPMTPAPVTPTKPVEPTAVSPVLADTQARLDKITKDLELMNDDRKHLNQRLDSFETSQNQLTKMVETLATSIKDLL